jgi:vancomycin resistance protein YoaR
MAMLRHIASIIKKKKARKYLLLFLTSILFPIILLITFNLYFWGKNYPNTSIVQVSVGSLTPEQTIKKLSSNTFLYEKLTLTTDEQTFEIPLEAIDFSYDFEKSANAAYHLHRSGNILLDQLSRLTSLYKQEKIGLRININEEKLGENLSVIAGQVLIEPVYPSVKLVDDEVFIDNGSEGQDVNLKMLRVKIGQNLTHAENAPITIPVVKIDPALTDEEVISLKSRAEKFVDNTITFSYEDTTLTYEGNDLVKLLNVDGGYEESRVIDLINEVVLLIDREPQNAVFVFGQGLVKEFLPAKDGVTTQRSSLKEKIIESLTTIEFTDQEPVSIVVPAKTASPEITTENVNDLGIKELIGKGTSKYSGSISSRIHNISHASLKFNGILIPPGEVFSFNNTLGDVSTYTGYKQAYIIMDGKTVLGDGGGVCQVSTTFFRAILDAGLPIVERRAHSYRVGYYEQDSRPGIDATVYAPTTDLKFKNDTPGHILIQTQANTRAATLAFEIYGTSDGRVSSTTTPVVTNVVPPPEDLYTDDPTLPAGTIKQIDWKAWGAKASFDYTVKRGGEIIYEKTFYSNYRPWQAKFLRGTGNL